MQEGTFFSRIKQWVTSLTRPLHILIKGRQGKTGEDTNGVNFQHSRLLATFYLFIPNFFILFLLSLYLRSFADFIGDNYCIVAHLE